MHPKGIIALDIDGTLTADVHTLDPYVADYLAALHQEGWVFLFVTGRPFEWGYRTLNDLPFPYFLGVQNGALLLEMPEKNIVSTHHLSSLVLPFVDDMCQAFQQDYVVYGGYAQQDLCYFRPKRFSERWLSYLQARCQALNERWIAVDDFNDLPFHAFPAIKFFQEESKAEEISLKLEEELGMHAPIIQDPFDRNIFVIQATATDATKERAMRDVAERFPGLPTIAAGDDFNDQSMLTAATISIAMATAPLSLRAKATIVAPPAAENGIISALKRATGLARR